jgi:hypothetical protein
MMNGEKGEAKNQHRVLVEKPEGRKQFGKCRPGRRWKDNINMGFTRAGYNSRA